MSFDARDIKLLSPGGHLTSAEHPGLRLEATESRRSWIYRYRSPIDGRLRQAKIGAWPQTSVHAAIVAWEQMRARRDAGEDPAEQARAQRMAVRATAEQARAAQALDAYTVYDVAMDYWRGHVQLHRAKKGVTEVRRMFNTMLGDTGKMPAHSLPRAAAFDLINKWALTVPVQAGKLRAELGAAWDYAHDAGRLGESVPNWWRLVMRGRIRSKGKKIAGESVGTVKRVLSAAEVSALIPWLPNFTALIEDVLTMYLWTATRGVEIAGMLGAEVVQEADGVLWWTVPKEKTKNARIAGATDLRVPLFGRARAVTLRRKARYGEGILYPARTSGKPRPVEQKTIQASVWTAQPYARPEEQRMRLPVTHWAPHDLRRTSRTLLASLGCPDAVGEVILGHVLPGVMGTYNRHTYDAERVVWLRKLSDHLEQLAGA